MDRETRYLLTKLLIGYGIRPSDDIFNTADGIVLLANLVNWSAKTIDQNWYYVKPGLVEEAMMMHNHCWRDGDIVYFETCMCQVSFHVFDEVEFDPMRTPKEWSGIETQPYACELLQAYIDI